MEGSKHHSSSCGELRTGVDYNKENNSVGGTNSRTRKANSEMDEWPGQRVALSGGAPFKDRTNRSRMERGEQKSSGVSTASTTTTGGDKAKVKTLNELVPPLNAARLRPIQQQTRSANVSDKITN